MELKREELVPPAVELPDNLPELYRAMVTDLAASLSDEAVSGRTADELHEIIDYVVVHWDADADGHCLELSGNLLEMQCKSAPSELDAVRGDIFAEVGCGSRQPSQPTDPFGCGLTWVQARNEPQPHRASGLGRRRLSLGRG